MSAATLCVSCSGVVERADIDKGLFHAIASAVLMLGSYYLVQPLSEVVALTLGLENLPYVSILNMTLITLVNPLYAKMAHALPKEHVMPAVNRTVQCGLLLLAVLFSFSLGQKAENAVSFSFYVFVSIYALFTQTTFWARMASLHTKEEAKRLYGFIGAGAQSGQLLASLCGPVLYAAVGKWVLVIAAMLMEISTQLTHRRALHSGVDEAAAEKLRDRRKNANATKHPEPGSKDGDHSTPSPSDRVGTEDHAASTQTSSKANTCSSRSSLSSSSSSSSSFEGLQLLSSTTLLRQITLHTLFTTFLALGIWYEKAAIVEAAFPANEDGGSDEANTKRYQFFTTLNAIISCCTLTTQLFIFPHVLKGVGFQGALLIVTFTTLVGFLPVLIQPGIHTIAFLDASRKVAHYSLAKPTKEGLYASLSPDIQFVAKPVLDTFVNRLGYLLCSAVFAIEFACQVPPVVRQGLLMAVAFAHHGNAWLLGRVAEEQRTTWSRRPPPLH